MRYENNTNELPLSEAINIAKIFNIFPELIYDDYNSFLAYPYSKK